MIKKIRINNKTYTLKYTLNFFEAYNAIAGEDISAIHNSTKVENIGIHRLVNVFKAGLWCNDIDKSFVDLEQEINEISSADFLKVIDEIADFFMDVMGVDKEDRKKAVESTKK